MQNKRAMMATLVILVATIAMSTAAQGTYQEHAGHTGQSDSKAQSVTVELTEKGYQPESLKLKRDIPARVTFVRKTDQTCGKEIVIKEYDIKRALPLDEPVVVEFTPRKSGEFAFTCGMNMLRGKIIVQEE